MKTPIEPSDIRKGDLIRWEDNGGEYAVEYRAGSGSDVDRSYRKCTGSFYLLDRTEPAVELPTQPTLGWITTDHGSNDDAGLAFVGKWHVAPDGMLAGSYEQGYRRITGIYSGTEHITAFVPATAVPTAALDTLREYYANSEHSRLIGDFLAAVDEANR